MKTYEEMAAAVFRRRDEALGRPRHPRKVLLRIGAALAACLVLLAGITAAAVPSPAVRPPAVSEEVADYIRQIDRLNETLIRENRTHIAVTITFSAPLTEQQLQAYLAAHPVEPRFVEGHLLQPDGSIVTFYGSARQGLSAVFSAAQSGTAVPVAVALCGYVDAAAMPAIIADPNTYLLDTNLYNPTRSLLSRLLGTLLPESEGNFPGSLAWELAAQATEEPS